MTPALEDRTVLHAPRLSRRDLGDTVVLIDPDTPNWLATDGRGGSILRSFDGRRSLGDVGRRYASETGVSSTLSWVHVQSVAGEALRAGMLARHAFVPAAYEGRARHLSLDRLDELWLQVNNNCNFSCSHCLVSSGPSGDRGMPGSFLRGAMDQAAALGVRRFYFTGGEPFLRRDIFELIAHAQNLGGLVVLSNGSLLPSPGIAGRLSRQEPEKLKLQISLDGATPEANDAIRGPGTFARAAAGIRTAAGMGLLSTVTAVVTRRNAQDLRGLPGTVRSLGGRNVHLLWLHRRGRALEGDLPLALSTPELIGAVAAIKDAADEAGVTVDNYENMVSRMNALPGTKVDLSMAGWRSLCVYADGTVYPSAATANEPKLQCGDLAKQSLKAIWEGADVLSELRSASVAHKNGSGCGDLTFLCGGGDVEHSYFFTGSFLGKDPYCDLHHYLAEQAFRTLSAPGRAARNRQSGWSAPPVWHAMGERSVHCATDGPAASGEVALQHSNCVLTFDVATPREVVRAFYAQAATTPQPELCCPSGYGGEDLSFLPDDVRERSYGCGSPVTLPGARPGETVLDLGSGGGIDCFLASRKVGPEGKVIGVDMTEEMLAVARSNRPRVAERLGFDNVEFRKGFLEDIPAAERSVDLVTSNCVVNLSADKRRVFSEIWRVLMDHGRMVLSDIVSEETVPAELRRNPRLWGECVSGALSESELLARMEEAGFHGIQVLSRNPWRTVEGRVFLSVTVRGYKYQKRDGCSYAGHRAAYLGPGKAVVDEEGHFFPRGEWIEVCTDTAAKLASEPYSASFRVAQPDGSVAPSSASADVAPAPACGPACC